MGTLHLAYWRRPRSERRAQRRGAAAARLVASVGARRCAPGGVRCRCCPRQRRATAAAVARRKTSVADANGLGRQFQRTTLACALGRYKRHLRVLDCGKSVRCSLPKLSGGASALCSACLPSRALAPPRRPGRASEVPPERDGGPAAAVPAPPATGASPRRWLGLAAGRHARLRGAGARPMRPAPLHDARDNRQLVRRDLCAVGVPNTNAQ